MTDHNIPSMPTDKELTARVTADLLGLPDQLRSMDMLIAGMRTEIGAAKRALEEAELDAQINAVVDGKNAEARKLQQEQAVRGSLAVREAREALSEREAELAAAETDYKALSRRWTAALALAEMQSAKINFLARVRPAPNGHTTRSEA